MSKPYLFDKMGSSQQKKNKQKILLIVLCAAIRLMHPMAPFITEELFSRIKEKFKDLPQTANSTDPYTQETLIALHATACIVAPFPQVICEKDIDPLVEESFSLIDQVLYAIRNIRAEMKVPPGSPTDLLIFGNPQDPEFKTIQNNLSILQSLVRIQNITLNEQTTSFGAEATIGNLKITIPIPQEMKEKEKTRLIKEKDKLIEQQNSARAKLANEDFVTKAPMQLVEKLKTTLVQSEKELLEIIKKLEAF